VAGCDDEDEEESLLKMEVEVDRCLLRLIAAACKGATLQSDRKKISLKLLLSVGWPCIAQVSEQPLTQNMFT
jgi:hypothetical protein